MFQTTIFACSLIEILLNFVEYSSSIGYSDMLKKLATIVYCLCFTKQALELLLHLSFKAELPTDDL